VHLIMRGSCTGRMVHIVRVDVATGVRHEEQIGRIRYPTDAGHSSLVNKSLKKIRHHTPNPQLSLMNI
jgi:hypothetical protein